MSTPDLIFAFILIAVLVWEFVAIVHDRRNDTISEKSWSLRDHALWGRMLIDTLVIWILWHIVIDPTFFEQGISWVDLIVVGVGVVWSYWSWVWQRNR